MPIPSPENSVGSQRELSLGCLFSDRVEALLDGRVTIPDWRLTIHCTEAQQLFRQTLEAATFDVAELSMASFIAAVAASRRDYVGLPVFLSRSFRHSNIYVRTDRGIGSPAGLAGRTIGLVDFQQTAALWLRGMLADEGVDRRSIRWVTAGLHQPMLKDRMPAPAEFKVERSGSTLDVLLSEGAIDAVISPTAPSCFTTGKAPVERLWPEYRAEELGYWRRTHIFPIMHIAVLRRSLADSCTELAPALIAAFEQARLLAAADLTTRDFPKVMMPWLATYAKDATEALGGVPWTYGLEENRPVLETMLRYAWADGLTHRLLDPEELFV